MAYVVATKPGRFEVRESVSTVNGPRSRTLANFSELTDEVVAKVRERADKPPTVEKLTRSALKAGAPVRGRELDQAAREAVRLMAHGERPDPMLRKLLLAALEGDALGDRAATAQGRISDAARAATQWVGVGAEERGRALRELLELADALPIRLRPHEISFPRLKSA